MYSVMNCTSHIVNVQQSAFEGRDVMAITTAGWHQPNHRPTADGPALIIKPSGRRLACDARTRGGPIGCQVTYALSEEALAELPGIFATFEAYLGVGMLVIASEISARGLAGQLYDPSGGLPIVATWPVFAAASLRLPMPDRWAAELATIHKQVRNEAGDIVSEIPLHHDLPRVAA